MMRHPNRLLAAVAVTRLFRVASCMCASAFSLIGLRHARADGDIANWLHSSFDRVMSGKSRLPHMTGIRDQ